MPFHLEHGGSLSVSAHDREKSVLSGEATKRSELSPTELPRAFFPADAFKAALRRAASWESEIVTRRVKSHVQSGHFRRDYEGLRLETVARKKMENLAGVLDAERAALVCGHTIPRIGTASLPFTAEHLDPGNRRSVFRSDRVNDRSMKGDLPLAPAHG